MFEIYMCVPHLCVICCDKNIDWSALQGIGHFHDGIILLQLPEFILFFFFKLFKFCNPSGQQRTIALMSTRKQNTEGFW